MGLGNLFSHDDMGRGSALLVVLAFAFAIVCILAAIAIMSGDGDYFWMDF